MDLPTLPQHKHPTDPLNWMNNSVEKLLLIKDELESMPDHGGIDIIHPVKECLQGINEAIRLKRLPI